MFVNNMSLAPINAYGFSQNLITLPSTTLPYYYGLNTTNVIAYNKGYTEALMSSRGTAFTSLTALNRGFTGDEDPRDFETAQKYFEEARKKASTFRRDCYSLYAIEHQNDKNQNETYRHICTSYSQDNLKQFADNQDSGLFFIASEVVAADGSRYTQNGDTIYDKINYIPQDGFVYHSSAGVLFDVSDFEACDFKNEELYDEEFINVNKSEYDDLSLSFFSEDSENTKTLSELNSIFGIDEIEMNEDDRDFGEMAKNRNCLIDIRNNTMDAYQTVKLSEFFGKGFKGKLGCL